MIHLLDTTAPQFKTAEKTITNILSKGNVKSVLINTSTGTDMYDYVLDVFFDIKYASSDAMGFSTNTIDTYNFYVKAELDSLSTTNNWILYPRGLAQNVKPDIKNSYMVAILEHVFVGELRTRYEEYFNEQLAVYKTDNSKELDRIVKAFVDPQTDPYFRHESRRAW